MSYYRKYRPHTIDEIDNSSVRKTLNSLLKKDKSELPHAFLFSGPHGTGKTTAARLVAKLFNCQSAGKNGAPCGNCSICKSIANGSLVDVMEIDAASNTGVDNIRDLREKIFLAPSQVTWKVYIIDEVHMLSTGAFNALLKTLEEPPEHAVFVLATTDPHKVPKTVRSRCLHIVFSKPTIDEIVPALERIAKAENISYEDDAISQVARLSNGSFRDAVKFLEQASLSANTLTTDVVEEALAMTGDTQVMSFVSAVIARKKKDAFDQIRGLSDAGKDLKSFITSVLLILQKDLRVQAGGESGVYQVSDIQKLIELLTDAYRLLKISPVESLPLELAVMKFIRTTDDDEKSEIRGGAPESKEKAQKPIKASKTKVDRSDAKASEHTATTDAVKSRPQKDQVDKFDQQAPKPTTKDNESAITLEMSKVKTHWGSLIDEIKPHNHSIAGLMRSTRPKDVKDNTLTIEAFYTFHHEKLNTAETKNAIAKALLKLFGTRATVSIVLGKK